MMINTILYYLHFCNFNNEKFHNWVDSYVKKESYYLNRELKE